MSVEQEMAMARARTAAERRRRKGDCYAAELIARLQ